MKVYVDIDETICHYEGVERLGYKNALPITHNIEKINKLYDEGHYIIYYTARGIKSGRGESYYRKITEEQLSGWGCKYHKLSFKPHDIDIFIDDRSMHPDKFFGDGVITTIHPGNIIKKDNS